MKLFIKLLIIPLLFASCAYHSGTLSNSANLSNNNFKIIGTAMGTATTNRILGIGGLSKEALVFEAKQDLYKNYPLQKGQTIANVTVDFKSSFFPLWDKTTAIIHAEIVDYNNDPKLKQSFKLNYKGLSIGDNVYFRSSKNHFLTGNVSNLQVHKIIIMIANTPRIFSYTDVFKKQGTVNINEKNIKVGTAIKFDKETTKTLIGYNDQYILVGNDGSHEVILIKDLKI